MKRLKKIGFFQLIKKIRAVRELVETVVEFVEYVMKHVKTDPKIIMFSTKIKNLLSEITGE